MKNIILLLLLLTSKGIFAQSIALKNFTNTGQEKRYQSLINEIRCPVCQGQSIGGSNAELAKDLRKKVAEMITKNISDEKIRQFMSARYGDFVVFKPPLNQRTYLLWFAPFVFLLLALLFFIRTLKSKQEPMPIDTAKAKALLNKGTSE